MITTLGLHGWRMPAVFLLALAAPVLAHAEKTLLATCTGAGADFVLTEVDEADAAIVYDLPPAPAAEAVLVVSADGSEAHWSTASRGAIDKQCGGDGDAEISLFQPIQPRDGTWSIKLSESKLDGCSGMMAGAVKRGMQSVMGREDTHQLDFKEPFHPHPLMAKADNVHWVQTGLNTWRAVMTQNRGDSGSMSITVTLDAEVVSPTHITETELFHMQMAPRLAKMMGGSGDCRATAIAELHWIE